MPTTILDGETYEQARHRRFTEEAKVIEKMQKDEIIRMAQEADLICESRPVTAWIESTDLTPYLTRFAALVAAHEAEKWKAENKRDYENWKMAAEKAAECEREACAKVCDEYHVASEYPGYVDCAAAIRARSEK